MQHDDDHADTVYAVNVEFIAELNGRIDEAIDVEEADS